MSKFKIIECPRDAMQSVKMFIPTEKKIKYIQSLIGVEFDTLDMGSFVSQKAIPQLKDTADVLNSLDLSISKTKFSSKSVSGIPLKEIIGFLTFPLFVTSKVISR